MNIHSAKNSFASQKRAANGKKPVNVSIDARLLEAARRAKINLSATLEKELRKVLADRWAEDNGDAIRQYNERIERDGMWHDGQRTW